MNLLQSPNDDVSTFWVNLYVFAAAGSLAYPLAIAGCYLIYVVAAD